MEFLCIGVKMTTNKCKKGVDSRFERCSDCAAKFKMLQLKHLSILDENRNELVKSPSLYSDASDFTNDLFEGCSTILDHTRDSRTISRLASITKKRLQTLIEKEDEFKCFAKNLKKTFAKDGEFTWNSLGKACGTITNCIPRQSTMCLSSVEDNHQLRKPNRKRKRNYEGNQKRFVL
jgi:hypothetical protein